MAAARVQRKLAAILAADVVGYSRLVREDEEGTLAAVKVDFAEAFDPNIAAHGGRTFKTMGDGLLAEFSSVVDAVRCAVEIQRTMANRNAILPEDRRIEFRIGINLGDVVAQGDDLHGDGVNVSARLEGIADPGGICISGTAFDHIQKNVDVGYEFLGEREVKNIAQPVRVYRVLTNPDDAGKLIGVSRGTPGTRKWLAIAVSMVLLAAVAGSVAWLRPWGKYDEPVATGRIGIPSSARPSIAVLPFANMSDEKEQEYFSDGMTEDLITDLSRISALTVIARSSTSAYKGKSPDFRNIAKDLGVTHVIEGSVRTAGGRVRITAQLIDATTGAHLWANRYDREMKDIFALQDEVRSRIVSALAIKLTPKEEKLLARPQTGSPEAYELYLKGLAQESFFTKDANSKAQELFRKAIELDPAFAGAYAHLAQAYSLAVENNWTMAREQTIEQALAAANKGVKLNDELPYAHWSLGRIYTRPYIADFDRAKAAFEKAIALNPNYADSYAFLGLVLIYMGTADEAMGVVDKAMHINPHYPFWYLFARGMAQLFLNRYDDAIHSFKMALERNPNVPWLHAGLIAAYGHRGERDEADWIISELGALGQPATIHKILERIALRDPVYRKFFEDGLRKAGVPE